MFQTESNYLHQDDIEFVNIKPLPPERNFVAGKLIRPKAKKKKTNKTQLRPHKQSNDLGRYVYHKKINPSTCTITSDI